jgi:membrane-associated protease RseP (regulator of RpoE activity)
MKPLLLLLAPMMVIFASYQANGQSPQDESSKRSYLGVQLMAGALVGSIEPDGPAQAAGIEPGDLIVRFDGNDIKDAAALSKIVAETPAGKDVVVTVIRRGKQGATTVKLGDQTTHFERATAEQLGHAYRDYLTLQVCAERLRQFERTKARLGAFLKSKEAAFSHELTDKLWNTVAAQFQKHENDLERTSNDQLAEECARASKQATALTGTDETTELPPMRTKDF